VSYDTTSIIGGLQIFAGVRRNTGGHWGEVPSRFGMPDVEGSGRWGPPDDGLVEQRFDLVLGNVEVDAMGHRGKDERARGNS
jgi:hypothetical protein